MERIMDRNSGKTVITPMDHGVTAGPVGGLSNIQETIRSVKDRAVYLQDCPPWPNDRRGVEGMRVVLLGAGGAARAIGFGLKERDCQLIIANRSRDRGEALSSELECHYLPMSSLFRMKSGDLEADVMINATSLGMSPQERESPVPKELFKRGDDGHGHRLPALADEALARS